MTHILLINGAKAFAHSHGKLNQAFHHVASEVCHGLGHQVQETIVDQGYDISEEISKFNWADIIIYQMPAWWMGAPWIVKKYLDEVLTEGHGTLYANDGRTRSDPSKKYGSGGLAHHKKYMLSLTWNAPEEAFTDPDQFFEGKGVDAVYFPFHKAHQFLGMTALPTFLSADVMKGDQVHKDIERYKNHLMQEISKSANFSIQPR